MLEKTTGLMSEKRPLQTKLETVSRITVRTTFYEAEVNVRANAQG